MQTTSAYGTPGGNRTHNGPLGGGCYIHLTTEAFFGLILGVCILYLRVVWETKLSRIYVWYGLTALLCLRAVWDKPYSCVYVWYGLCLRVVRVGFFGKTHAIRVGVRK